MPIAAELMVRCLEKESVKNGVRPYFSLMQRRYARSRFDSP